MDPSRPISDSHRIVLERQPGDQSSLWRLTETLRPYFKQVVRNQLNGRLPEKFDESDVVQSALARAVSKVDQFDGQTEVEWKAWLAAICRNETNNAVRHWFQQRRNVVVENGLSDPAELADAEAPANGKVAQIETTAQVLQAIERLPEEQQRLIQLRHFENRSHREIAEMLDISVVATRQRWHATLVKLKNVLSQQANGSGRYE